MNVYNIIWEEMVIKWFLTDTVLQCQKLKIKFTISALVCHNTDDCS